jgi:hypothetical protein
LNYFGSFCIFILFGKGDNHHLSPRPIKESPKDRAAPQSPRLFFSPFSRATFYGARNTQWVQKIESPCFGNVKN